MRGQHVTWRDRQTDRQTDRTECNAERRLVQDDLLTSSVLDVRAQQRVQRRVPVWWPVFRCRSIVIRLLCSTRCCWISCWGWWRHFAHLPHQQIHAFIHTVSPKKLSWFPGFTTCLWNKSHLIDTVMFINDLLSFYLLTGCLTYTRSFS